MNQDATLSIKMEKYIQENNMAEWIDIEKIRGLTQFMTFVFILFIETGIMLVIINSILQKFIGK